MPSNRPPYLCPLAPLRQVNVMCSSPVPQSQSFCNSVGSCSHGVSSIVPWPGCELARPCRPRLDKYAAASAPSRATADQLDAALLERSARIGNQLRESKL